MTSEASPLRISLVVGGRSIEHDSSLEMYYVLRELLCESVRVLVTDLFYECRDGKCFVHRIAKATTLPTTESELRLGERLSREQIPFRLASTESFLFSLLQGTEGEDGHYQGLARLLDIDSNLGPVFPAAVSTNKWAFGVLAQSIASDVLTPIDSRLLRVDAPKGEVEAVCAHFQERPCVVKPNNLGISFLCEFYSEGLAVDVLAKHLEAVRPFDEQVVVQEWISGREISCGTLQVETTVIALPVLELHVPNGILDYGRKFTPSAYSSSFLSQTDELAARVSRLCVNLSVIVGFETACRYDLIQSNCGRLHLLEANSKPGLTRTSLYTRMLAQGGVSLIDFILLSAENDKRRFVPRGRIPDLLWDPHDKGYDSVRLTPPTKKRS